MREGSEALDILRKRGMKVNVPSKKVEFGYGEETVVSSIEVMHMNHGGVKLKLVDVNRDEKSLEVAIQTLYEAISLLREEIDSITGEDHPW